MSSDFYNDLIDQAKNMNAGALDAASIMGDVKTPINEYPDISKLTEFITKNESKAPVEIDLKKLSKNGKVIQDPMETYLAADELPSSGLKEVLKNPANFYFYLNDRSLIYEDPKKHFTLGTFGHSAVLEPELFDKVKVEPKASLASLDGAKKLLEFYEETNGKLPGYYDSYKLTDLKDKLQAEKDACEFTMIKEDDKIIIDIMNKNQKLYANGIIAKIMKGAKTETSFYGVDRATGMKVKVRPDAFNVAANIGVNAVISVKTTSAQSIEKFISDSARYQYELSEGMYQEVMTEVTGIKFDVTIMIMLQTVAPYLPAVLWWSPEDLQNGKYKYRYALQTAKDCIEFDRYPGYESLAESGNLGIISMKQPSWASRLLSPIDLED